MSKQLLVVLGMPGAGKDTQIAQLQTRRAVAVLRVGDLVRARAKTDAGLAKSLEKGDLVSDEVVNELVVDAMSSGGENVLISDGFPRDLAQAKWLTETMQDPGYELIGALYLHISDNEALKRLLARGRSDDDEATIRHRVEVFHTQTDPVIDYYRQQNLLFQVDGEQSVEAVAKEIQEVLGW